ncbi:MAG: DegT/DnrJ/EryC1/StrS family aminotransferase, partial [Polyangiales bacterium]
MTATRITFAAPARELADLGGAIEAAAARVLRSGEYVLGDDVARFEAAFAQTCDVAHVVGVSSGSDALVGALLAVGVTPGDVVVVPAYSFVATAEAIVRVGATPRYCDVTADEALLDVERAAAIFEGARAVLVVALYGRLPDVASLRALGLPVVIDAAQAVGVDGALAAGDVACASFYPSKALGAAGDAGACATNDTTIAARLREIRQHGLVDRHRYARVGGNFRLDAIQAAILEAKLPRLPARMARRNAISRALRQALGLDPSQRPTSPFVAVRVVDRD